MHSPYVRLLWLVLASFLLLGLGQIAEAASPPQPTYGTAVVDGNISEWNLTNDFFANMYRAGRPTNKLESKLYLRYNCATHTLYVLVLAQPGVVALAQGWETSAWGAIGTVSNKVYTGNSGNPPTPPQFAWVGLSGDGLTAQGYEASFIINPGTPISPAFYTLIVHVEVFDDSAAHTAATAGFPLSGVQLELICIHPAIQVVKSYAWTTGDGSHVGDVVTFTYKVTNTGDITLNPVTLVDDQLGAITLGSTSLAPGAFTTGTKTLTLTQALLDAGSQTNIATATGTPPSQYGHPDVTSTTTKTVTFIHTPSIEVVKNFAWTTGDGSHVGDIATYTFTVTNTGNVTLNPVTLTDSYFGPITLGSTNLAPGASTTGTATLTLTQALLDAVTHTNTATATGTPPSGPNVTSTATKTITFIHMPSIEVVKNFSWTTGDGSHIGDVVTYTFTVTNTGNVTLNPVTLTDDKFGPITLGSTNLAPGAVTTGTATLTLTQALLNAGTHTNTATATGKPPSGPDVTSTATKTVTFITTPSIEVVKNFAWTTGDGSHVGDVVTYTFTVTNTGNVTLNPVTLVDDKFGPITLGSTNLAPGAVTTGTATLTLTQALLNVGSHTNTATATGTPPSGPDVTSTTTKTVTFIHMPSIEVVKNFAWTTGDGSHIGDVVTYTFTVTNTGNVTLNPVTLVDDKFGPITLGSTNLAPGAVTTGTATLTLTQPLLDAGTHTNTATATGTPPSGPDVTSAATKTVTFNTMASVNIQKTFAWTSGDGTQVGDIVTYTYTVTNTGNVTLNSVSVSDDKLGPITLGSTTLAPGATTTGTASLTLTAELMALGFQTNIATVTATPPSGPNVTGSDSETVKFGTGPSIDLQKTFAWTTGNGSQVGDVVTYTYTVKNTGTTNLVSVTVSDDKLGSISLGSTSLAPGATTTGTATLTLTQALLDAGLQTNTATATGTPPTGPDVSKSDSQTVTFLTTPSVKVIKTFAWTTGEGSQVGDVVTFTYTVTNNGNVTLNPVSVNDDKLGPITLLATSLAPGATTTGTATLTLTQALLDAGLHVNTATATATPPSGPDVTDTSTRTVTFTTTPSVKVIKTFEWTSGNGSQVGDVVTFTYTVTNDGNVTLNPVSVNDDKLGPITLLATSLAPGATTTGTATLTLTQALLDAGLHINTATATATPPSGPDVTDTSTRTVTFTTTPSVKVVKTFEWTTGNGSQVGDVVTFTYTVTNDGNVTLNPVSVNDDKLGLIALLATSLAPGATTTGTATLTLTQPLLDAGLHVNTATATATPPSGPDITDTSTRTVTFITTPSVKVVKDFAWTTGNGSQVGDVVTYTYTVINNGNVTLNPVSVNDDKLGPITLLATSLAPGATTTGTAALTITQAMLDAGSHVNTATATATPPSGPDITDQSTRTVTFLTTPSILLVKTFGWSVGDGSHVGDVVTFFYSVTNEGNVTLNPVTVNDDQLGPITLHATSLAPGATTTGTATLTLTQEMLDVGSHINTATATGTPPSGPDVTDTSTRTVTFTQDPQIGLVKYVSVDGGTTWEDANVPPGPSVLIGNPVQWRYVITNTGNVTLTGLTLSDDHIGPIALSTTTLAPNGHITAYAGGTAISGLYTNIATAIGIPPIGTDVQTSNAANYTGVRQPTTGVLAQAYGGSSADDLNRAFRGYLGMGDDAISSVPGVFWIDPGDSAWANFVAAAQLGVPYTLKNVTMTKVTPAVVQCSDIFPEHIVNQQGTDNIRLWWPLMYEIPGTTWTLNILYGTQAPFDDDGDGPNQPSYAHVNEWKWEMTASIQSMKHLIDLFHELPFGLDEVPLISDENLYITLQGKLDEIDALITSSDTAGASLLLGDFELMVSDACIGVSPGRPIPAGVGTGIANTAENPACCKLLADVEYIGRKLGAFIPSK